VTCPECGAKVKDNEAKCFYCGTAVRQVVVELHEEKIAGTPPEAESKQPIHAAPVVRTSSGAKWALALGIASIIMPELHIFYLPFLIRSLLFATLALLAVIFGATAVARIRAAAGRLSGMPMAIIGIVLGVVAMVRVVHPF
jgi:hypothetical protein